jgi:hypothetical protein
VNDRRHSRHDDELDRGRAAVPPATTDHANETANVLALQGLAGNRAVAGLLEARGADAGRTPVQLQPEGPPTTAESVDDRTTSGTPTMAIPRLDLSIPILSFSQQAGQPNQPKRESGEMTVTLAVKDLDPRIAQAAAKGDQFEPITITVGTTTLTLHNVVFSSYSISQDTVALGLNFASIERHTPGEDATGP